MRRLIRSRGVWLALVAALAAAVTIVVFVRSRRPPTDTVQRSETPAPVEQWPPAPILGTPTAADLSRFAARPSVLDRPGFIKFFEPGEPRKPLEEPVRRRLVRWGMAGFALFLLVVGTQVLENMVFAKETETVVHEYSFTGYPADVPNGDNPPQPATYEKPPKADEDCAPRSADPRVRKVSAKVTRAVNRQWRRIETWLKTNAPTTYRTLGEPGDAEAIAAAEAHMGVRFPNDLRASLLRHDGSVFPEDSWPFGFLGHANLNVREIRDEWSSLCAVDGEDEGEEGFSLPRQEWWDGRMIPFAADGSGDNLVIDSLMRDVGETDHEGTMSFTPAEVPIRSYYALLKRTADAMENGGSIGSWKPRAVGGELAWDAAETPPSR
ncbi:SMI1/KNR4 family protein [Nonomuraea glycinis]|uniref:SMI1/KNR4 family protein n=1 Tax=Nonomuraea glycinis TaxID=2047744 RepID=UPI00339EA34D